MNGDSLFDGAAEPAARHTDPETSHEAAASVTHVRARQQAVLDVLERVGHPMTDEQIGNEYRRTPGLPGQSPSGLRTRRSELVDRGLVEFSGEFSKTAAGRRTRLWRLTTR